MANEAPDPRAKAIADKILGKGTSDFAEATSLLVGGASVGQRGEDGKPLAAKATPEIDEDEETPPDPDAEDDEAGEDGDDGADDDDGDEEEIADDEEENEQEDDGDEYEELDYSDDDEIEVTVDGETRTATLRDLKKAFSGEGAIEKRLQEATEARKEANAAREAVVNEVNTHRANLMQTIQQLDQVLFMPLVDEPDPKLRATNINAYLMQKDAWEEDQKRIVKSRTDMAAFFTAQQKEMADSRNAFRQEQIKLLQERMPEITDPVKGPKLNQDILNAAATYGFTPAQVAQVDNHGLFLMARDAARWLNLQKLKQNGGPSPSGGEKLRRKKRLRSGTVAQVKTKLVRNAKEQRAATDKAQRSGKVDDVAAMLMSKARTVKGPNRGRPS